MNPSVNGRGLAWSLSRVGSQLKSPVSIMFAFNLGCMDVLEMVVEMVGRRGCGLDAMACGGELYAREVSWNVNYGYFLEA